jgi:uncharacterized protein
MRKELQLLAEMQKRDDRITELQVLVKNLPEQLNNLKKNVSVAKEELENVQSELDNNRKEQDMRELEIKSNKEVMGKYQNQLLTIQTNKEYKALNREVSHLEQKNIELEDEIVALMEQNEEYREHKAASEKAFERALAELKANEKRLEDEIETVQIEMEKYSSERKVLAGELPTSLVKKYAALIKNRNRKALVYLVGNSCGGCGFMIRPQVMVDLHEGEKIIYCEGCGRFIVFDVNR